MDAGELYELQLDRFVAERNGLARRLRADGRREEAATVAALRKPSVAAHGVNLLAHEAKEPFRELFAAGDALRATQARVLAGDADGRELGRALERERTAVEEMTRRAAELLAVEGHEPGAAVLQRAGETLHAAALDDEARQRVISGRLDRELRHTGFGAGGEATEEAPPAKKRAAEAKAKRRKAAQVAKAAKAAAAAHQHARQPLDGL